MVAKSVMNAVDAAKAKEVYMDIVEFEEIGDDRDLEVFKRLESLRRFGEEDTLVTVKTAKEDDNLFKEVW